MAEENLKIVSIGSGAGQAALLRGLKQRPVNLTAVVSTSDNGGHSGKLRKLFNIPQVGEGRQCVMALAEDWVMLERFKNLPTGFHPGNWFLAELLMEGYNLTDALAVFGSLLNAKGEVIPATEAIVDIGARLDDKEITGEWEILDLNQASEIKELFLITKNKTKVKANARAIAAMEEADWLVMGPGSLRTSIISALLPKGIKEAILASKAKIIFVCNLITKPGQTDNFTAADHVRELIRYLGRCPDYLIVNNKAIPHSVAKHYYHLHSRPVALGDVDSLGLRVIKTDLLPSKKEIFPAMKRTMGLFKKWTDLLTHDSNKTAEAVWQIIKNEVK
ncbi:MAG: YvcK family protein [Candidatus Komeilibacteria bacterium]|nr:YvcK family protein [Candidatus Komeilibacteria bacterium]